MKKVLTIFLLTLTMSLCWIFGVSCAEQDKHKLFFIANEQVVFVVETKGNETIIMPADPTKEGFVFDGWYFDSNVWENEFNLNSFLNEPVEEDTYVYAKFTEINPPQHVHEHTSQITKEASCAQKGEITYTCECGDSYTEEIDKLPHTQEVIPAVAPTCTTTGLTEGKKCSVCKEILTAQTQVDKIEHSYSSSTTPATCTNKGKVVYLCECGDSYVEEIDKLKHTEKTLSKVDATCTTTGLTEGKKCSVCGEIIVAQQVVDKLAHEYTKTVISATCTTKGYTKNECDCGESFNDNYVDELGHNETVLVAKEPTCTEKGLTEGKKCLECGVILIEQQTLPIIAHNYNVSIVSSTCTEKGRTIYTCDCGDTYFIEDIDALGHDKIVISAIAPTCTTTGLTEGEKCSRCGLVFVEQQDVAKTEHNYVTQEIGATCSANGKITKTCDCGYVIVNETPKLSHTVVTSPAVAPTCTTTGKTEGKVCSVCEAIIQVPEDVPALEHVFTKSTIAPTCTTKGYDKHECSCGYCYLDAYVNELGHTQEILEAVDATCTTTGLTEGKKCSVCEEILLAQNTINALGHSYEIETTPATCDQKGSAKYTCHCGYTYTEEIEKLSHSEQVIVGVAPTCTTTGLTDGKKCTACGEITVEQTIIQALGHTQVILQAVNATCTTTGLTEGKKCSVCDEIIVAQQLVDKLAHTEKTLSKVDATCTTTGLTEGKECSVCGEIIVAQQVVDKLAHEYTKTVIPATCTTKGYTKNECDCGESFNDNYVDELGHTETVLVAKEPTCTEKGLTEGKKCSVCQEVLLAQTEISALGHSYQQTRVEPTCISEGSITYACHCGDTNTQTLEKTAHVEAIKVGVAPTCTTTGLTDGKYCAYCTVTIQAQQVMEATGHDFESSTIQPTCTEQGYLKNTCSKCGEVEKSEFKTELGHSYTNYQNLGNGKEKATCDRGCGSEDEKEVSIFTVIFNTNGGSAVDNKTYERGLAYGTLPTTTKEGYSFLGWYTTISNGVQIQATDTINSNHAIFAYWQALEYTVTFNANTGNVDTTSKTVTFDTVYGDLPTPTKDGYRFLGWYMAIDGGTQVSDGAIVKTSANHTLYAHWKQIIMYTITLNANGGTGVSSVERENDLPYGSLPVPTKTGYNFKGWYTSASDGSKIEVGDIVTASVTLYAQWEAKKLTVTFAQTGRTIVDPKEVAFGLSYGTLVVPERYGYTFLGWYTEADGGERVTEDTIVSIGDNHTLYGHWQGLTYTLTLNANGGSVSTTTMQITNGTTYGTLPTPTRENYLFSGWFTKAEGGGRITENSSVEVTANQTIYAQWIQQDLGNAVTFKQDGKQDVVVYVEDNGVLDKSSAPLIEQKTGYTASWTINGQPTNLINIVVTDDMTITLAYTPKQYTVVFKYDYIDSSTNTNPSISGLSSMTVTYGEAYTLPALDGANYHQATGWLINGTLFTSDKLTGDSWNIDSNDEIVALVQGAKVKYTFKQDGYADVVKYFDYGSTISTADFPEVQGLTEEQVGGWQKLALYEGTLALKDRTIEAVVYDKDFSPAV